MQAGPQIFDFAISPDGRLIAFDFVITGKAGCEGLGLYDWQADTLTRIPNPPGSVVTVPSFSYDGRRLAVTMRTGLSPLDTDIAVIDLATGAIVPATRRDPKERVVRTGAVFQPRTGNILFVEEGLSVPRHLKMLNIETHTEAVVLGQRAGFRTGLYRISFVDEEEIYFTARSPVDPDLRSALTNLLGPGHGSMVASTVGYRFRFGGKPEILLPELQRTLLVGLHIEGPASLTASRGGAVVVYVGINNPGPEWSPLCDLYQILPDGSSHRLTNLEGIIDAARISYDGSTVAFTLAKNGKLPLELMIFDMKRKKLTTSDLRRKLFLDPNLQFC
jgi:hypothetical protein